MYTYFFPLNIVSQGYIVIKSSWNMWLYFKLLIFLLDFFIFKN